MLGTQVEEMCEVEILDFADECARTVQRAEVDLLRAAYQWAVVHDPARLDPSQKGLPGRERSRCLGGQGVPEVTEFAAAEFGARIGRSPYAAAQLIADAQDLHHRHPLLWSRVEAGEVRASYARHVTAKTRHLSPTEAAYVDDAVAESADGRIPWSRFEMLVDAKVAAAAPEVARAKEEKAREARFAKKLHGEAHGMASFMVRADVATINAIDAAVTALADQLLETMPDTETSTDPSTVDDRRVRAVLLLANPGSSPEADVADLLPSVQLYVHVYAGASTSETEHDPEKGPQEPTVRVEGHGPVTAAWLRDVLGPKVRFRVTPVIDLAGQAPVDAYEIPDRHRQAVHLLTPADTFPYSSSLSRTMQVDHTVPFHDGGRSGVGNYGPMITRHHRIKTHGGWDVKQPFPGIYLWRDPHGAHYLVDHTGTRRIRGSGPKPLVIEIYRKSIPIEHDAA